MANVAVSIFGTNLPIRLTDIGDGSYALATHAYAVGQPLGANDKVLSLTGTNLPVRVSANGDGSYAIGVAIPVSAGAAGDASVSIFGINYPSRLVALGDGTYALGVEPQAVGTAMVSGDCVASMLGINVPVRLIKQSKGDYAVAIASAVTPRPAADMVASLWGVNPPSRLVGMGDRTFALASDDYFQKVLGIAPSNLIALWPLNEASGITAFDQSGNGRNGTYVNAPTLGQPGIGDGGTAPLFAAASTQYISFSGAPLAGLQGAFNGSEGTLALWFRVRAASVWSDAASRVLAIFAANGNNLVFLQKTTVAGQIVGQYKAGAVTKQVVVTSGNPTTWQTLAINWSKSADQVKVYYQGSPVGAAQTGLGVFSGTLTANDTQIAADAGATLFDGYIAQVGLWSKALTDAQVLALATVP